MQMSQQIRDTQPRKSLLQIKLTEREIQPSHVTQTRCKPGLVAAFEGDWLVNDPRKVNAWGLIHLVGEVTSPEKLRENPIKQANFYLHYLVLARPDLYISHGLLIEETSVTFLAGITGKGIYSTRLDFTDERLLPLLYGLIHHIYDPGTFKDEHYEVAYNDAAQACLYTLFIKRNLGQAPLKFPALKLKYASSPFASCTYVFVVHPELGGPIKLPNGILRVIKDQFCGESRFNEPEIIKHIHADGFVPGVINLIHDESWEPPKVLSSSNSRVKRRLGFEQNGTPFMGINTIKGMLETAFDILEVTRYLRMQRNVLHRDISSGNILVDTTNVQSTPYSGAQDDDNDTSPHTDNTVNISPQELDICFIKHLGECPNPRQTNVILIDFNRSERLCVENQVAGNYRTVPGTPLFVARAIQHGKPFPQFDLSSLAYRIVFPPIPPALPAYAQLHAQRVKVFDGLGMTRLDGLTGAHLSSRQWRHELYHDAEAVYWLIAYWFMCAKPMQPCPEDFINLPIYLLMRGSEHDRHWVIERLADERGGRSSLMHSALEPVKVGILLSILSAIIRPCPHYLEDTDVRTRPEYVHEAFQRAILNFIFENRDEAFMTLTIHSESRQLPPFVLPPVLKRPRVVLSPTTSPTATGSKRPSPSPISVDKSDEKTELKRRRCMDENGSSVPR